MQLMWPVLRSFLAATVLAAASWAVVMAMVGGPRCACSGAYEVKEHPRLASAIFGVQMPAADEGGVFLVETDRVPLVAGATFGWRMQLNDGSARVKLREELELPTAPRVWRHTDDTSISSDRTTAVTERVVQTADGWLENAWAFTEGDPEGRYRLRVFLDDELVKEFTFFADDLGPSRCGHR